MSETLDFFPGGRPCLGASISDLKTHQGRRAPARTQPALAKPFGGGPRSCQGPWAVNSGAVWGISGARELVKPAGALPGSTRIGDANRESTSAACTRAARVDVLAPAGVG
jgi:hypothetical protein